MLSKIVVPMPEAPDGGWNLSAAREYCKDLAENHYENFPVGSRWIRPEIRPHIHAVYAFARLADDFADEAEHQGARLERLSLWRKALVDAASGHAVHPAFIALADTIKQHDVPTAWLDDLIVAFEQDVSQSRHPNFDSIVDYAKRSANPIGRLVLWLNGFRDVELFSLSDAICSALQFANFWQDVSVDWKKDRVYLPQEDMQRFGYTEKDIKNQVVDDRFQKLLQQQIERTWTLFWKGRSLCDRIGPPLRTELRLVWLGGTRILEQIERANYDVYRKRPKLNWQDKGLLAWRLLRWKPKTRMMHHANER